MNESGYTIVELIVAIVIGALFTSAVSTMIDSNSYLSQKGRDSATTTSFAENKFEALRSAGYLSLTNGTTNISNELPNELNAPKSASLTISQASTSVKKIDLSISYNDRGNTKTYSFTTLIGELGVGQN